MRQQLLEFRQEFQAQFAVRKDVAEDEHVRWVMGNRCQRLAAGRLARQAVTAQRLLINFKLQVVVFILGFVDGQVDWKKLRDAETQKDPRTG